MRALLAASFLVAAAGPARSLNPDVSWTVLSTELPLVDGWLSGGFLFDSTQEKSTSTVAIIGGYQHQNQKTLFDVSTNSVTQFNEHAIHFYLGGGKGLEAFGGNVLRPSPWGPSMP